MTAALALALVVSACAPQNVKEARRRTPENAAAETMLLDPGAPPPTVLPDVPMRSARRRGQSDSLEKDDAPTLRLATTVRGADDVWARLRRQFRIDRPYGSRMQREIAWFQRNQAYLDRTASRARPYLPYIVREAERRGLPVELALLPVVESAFQPFAYSPARAAGLWQFIPATARLYGLRINWWYDGRRDVVEATRAAFDYLEKLNKEFDGDWLLAVAAYNWGEGNVARARARNRKNGKATDFWALRLPAETYAYVPKWLAVCEIISRPERYELTLQEIPDEIYFRRVTLQGQIDLSVAAELAGLTLDELHRLNPGYRRWATDPDGPHVLLVPAKDAKQFARRVAQLPPEQRVTWRQHEVQAGDTLGEIAEHYGTSVSALTKLNRIVGTLIRTGQSLVVPAGPVQADLQQLSAQRQAGLALADGASASARIHVVRNGESLWRIARRYRVTVRKLAAWNGLDPGRVLRPGQRLKVRGDGGSTQRGAGSSGEGGLSAARVYVVRNGDNLWNIARRHHVSTRELADWNDLALEAILQPGQRLRVHSPARATPVNAVAAPQAQHVRYEVQPGDSLWDISRRFGVSVGALRRWNELPDGGHIRPGQALDVYTKAGET